MVFLDLLYFILYHIQFGASGQSESIFDRGDASLGFYIGYFEEVTGQMHRPLKVLRIISRLNIGGPAIHSITLTGGLDKARFESVLITGRPAEEEGDMSYLAYEKNVKPIVIDELRRQTSPLGDIKAFFKIYGWIRKIRPDIVHTHASKAGTLGRLAALAGGVPVKIHTFHGHVLYRYFSPVKSKIYILIERILSHFTDRIVAVSKRQQVELTRILGLHRHDKCVIIPLGLDLKPFLAVEESENKDALTVGMIGRLTKIKNHKMFLDGAALIKKKAPNLNVRFVIVGDGELKYEISDYIKKLGLEKDVLMIGWKADLASIYSGLDVVALTSDNEGTPLCIIEAMASARPVVATDVGGVGDLVIDDKTGYLVWRGDVEAFSDRVLDLLKDKTRRRAFGAAARNLAASRYTEGRLIGDIERLYEECWKEKQNRRMA